MSSSKTVSVETGRARRESGRRSFVKQALLMAAGLPASSILPPAFGDAFAADKTTSSEIKSAISGDAVAETTFGRIRGLTYSDGTKAFKGVPYGANTATKNRFMPPFKPTPWPGVRDCLQWGHTSPMITPAGPQDFLMEMLDWLNQPGGQGEDCLVLNVWTPGIKDGGKRPVMFWIHGGAFTTGSSGNPAFDGQHLATRGNVVVVSINHRLGCFGYLHLGDLGGGPDLVTSGNAGMLDCVAALEWVRDNIESFGGDPNSVTIFGQSGGGIKVCTLMTMPAAHGLFHKAIIQSGSTLRLATREAANQIAERFLKAIGIDKTHIDELRQLPVEQLLAAQQVISERTPPAVFLPFVDGDVIPQHPFDPVASSLSARIPIIIGTTRDDAAYRTEWVDTDEQLQSQEQTLLKSVADRVVSTYRRLYPDLSPFRVAARINTDRGPRKTAIDVAERKLAAQGAEVYMYRWDWPSPGAGGKYGAVHGTETPLVFDNPNALPSLTGTGPDVRSMAEKISSAWIAFAKSGNPNTEEIPKWPAFTLETRATMVFNTTCRVDDDPDQEVRLLWKSVST
jgi:para-nitrobenzyl esterase